MEQVYHVLEIKQELPIQRSLIDLREQMLSNYDDTLAIPDMIGCGIDGLDRQAVVDVITEVFKDTDIIVYAVKLK